MQENVLNEKRKLWKYILFGALTFGIYDIVFMWKLVKDLNCACGSVECDDEEKSPGYILIALFTILTFGIYRYVWFYKQGNRMKRAGAAYGLEIDEKGSTYVLWILLGIWLFGIGPFVALYLFISNLNKLCRMYNRKNAEAQQPEPPELCSGPIISGDDWKEGPRTSVLNDAVTVGGMTAGKIRCMGGIYKGAEIELQLGKELVIGRNSEVSQLILDEKDISRKHCSIYYAPEDGNYYVTDFSTYGVYVNDHQRLEKNVRVKCPPGTVLALSSGNNVFILQ